MKFVRKHLDQAKSALVKYVAKNLPSAIRREVEKDLMRDFLKQMRNAPSMFGGARVPGRINYGDVSRRFIQLQPLPPGSFGYKN